MLRIMTRLPVNFRQFAIFLSLLCALSCRGGSQVEESADSMPKRDITVVMDAHVKELMAIPGVTGVAVGALENGTPCILVLVLEETEQTKKAIPKEIEGHPVKIFESGEIKPMDGD